MIAVLCAREDSIYKSLSGCDVYDAARDARSFSGGLPVVAHPPCRSWGRLRRFARPRPGERELAIWCVEKVRTNGGVLEHPAYSTLWRECGLPKPGEQESISCGWTLPILQWWFGHRAEKATWLYVVGVRPVDMLLIPLRLGYASHVVSVAKSGQVECTKSERERTPDALTRWLVAVAEGVSGYREVWKKPATGILAQSFLGES